MLKWASKLKYVSNKIFQEPNFSIYQCDQMASLLIRYLTIYNNEKIPNSMWKLSIIGLIFCQILRKPQKIAKNF